MLLPSFIEAFKVDTAVLYLKAECDVEVWLDIISTIITAP